MCHQMFKDKGSDRGGFGGRGRGRRDQSGTTETILMRIISPLNGTKSQTIMGKGGKVMMVLSVGAKEVVIRGQGIGILGLTELAIN